jgi:copper(I)-binding protein
MIGTPTRDFIMPRHVPVLLVLASLALIGCGRERPLAEAGSLSVIRGWAYPSTAGLAGAYLVLANAEPAPDTLVQLSGPEVGDASMHGVRREGVSSVMYPIDQLEIPARGRVSMRPGGVHIMMSELAREITVGDTIALDLRLARAGQLTVRVPVVPYGEIPE